jgi:hypothetical protein
MNIHRRKKLTSYAKAGYPCFICLFIEVLQPPVLRNVELEFMRSLWCVSKDGEGSGNGSI